MPHKHTRKGTADKSTTDLPPTTLATPLPVSKSANENSVFTSSLTNARRGNKKRKRNVDTADDTPKAFARLMAFSQGKRMAKGLDDGVKVPKKKKVKVEGNAEDAGEKEHLPVRQEDKAQMPTIKPGERMAEFSARVDAALPVSGLINKTAKGGKDPLGLKVGRTKKEKKMHKMYAEWREQDVRIKEKREAAQEEKEMDDLEEGEGGQVIWADSTSSKKKKGKGKKKRVVGEIEDGENDPWAKIQRERGGKVAFGDVVQAPPTFTKAPKEKFKVRGAKVEVGDVPKASGSLRRREELGEVRRSVVEGYRAMMNKGNGSRGGGEVEE
ncbi:UPF0653 protein [Lachnellula arida]|uniref:UPF0653 protein n=1 Tax=Lachnellula arida TaxID=1316785 RepID=A0A8T9BMP1_9HELO|nr:UPF0653 protein [Lachnellula arida]